MMTNTEHTPMEIDKIVRKLLILLMAMLLPLSALEISADEKGVIQKIPLQIGKSTILKRDCTVPIEANYYGMISGIQTSVSEDIGEVEVLVTNTSTGEFWMTSFDSSNEQQSFLQISGTPGCYEIEYITESGDVYEGEFLIE